MPSFKNIPSVPLHSFIRLCTLLKLRNFHVAPLRSLVPSFVHFRASVSLLFHFILSLRPRGKDIKKYDIFSRLYKKGTYEYTEEIRCVHSGSRHQYTNLCLSEVIGEIFIKFNENFYPQKSGVLSLTL